MTALAKQRTDGSRRYISRNFEPLAANAKVYPGALAIILTSGANAGYYEQGQAATGQVVGRFTGLASVAPGTNGVIDNTGGANGAILAEIERFDPFWVFLAKNDTVSAVVVADRGSLCYDLDDQTVTHAVSGNAIAGIVYDVTTEGVWFSVPLAGGAASGGSSAPRIQKGTSTLAIGTKSVAADITASSIIQITMRDPGAGAITGLGALDVPVGTRVVGAPGSFVVNAIDDSKNVIATAVSTFDWVVIG